MISHQRCNCYSHGNNDYHRGTQREKLSEEKAVVPAINHLVAGVWVEEWPEGFQGRSWCGNSVISRLQEVAI